MTDHTSPVVLITGASSGIGRATTELFAAQGWRVAATMRNLSQGADLAGLPNVEVLPLDVTDASSVRAAVAETLDQFGRIDALVNNAGYGLFGPFETASDEQISRQFATNVDGIFAVTRAVLPAMRSQGSGTIINVASLGGLIALPLFSLYNATKFAVVGFTEALSYELAPLGIKAKYIAPGGVATDFAGRSMVQTFDGVENAYGDTLSKVVSAMTGVRTDYSSPESIAEVIFSSATDGTGQVMYLAGQDADQAYALQRSLSEAEKLEMVRQRSGL
ncbi:NAD(P)-dependent dehydrogenase (short-subunit alcohol dehydrogenase family) [Rhizobium binae]|uniref:NAD(P)-dependent dehydrogenase (Short-subunit alcohol dehydrogenase family) n=1 Tax=Rhizobium binae TaxID=1138190 RepID=A0ABV2ME47_9HYPH|nr:SDR family oxidoreductase [Rhizobium binae]MBX4961355.1 SDR family oxidoreductase [Rhizobium binae]MBX4992931.1 SDR family oxidoreductase [Rhizobium binae]NKL47236.1 SDR family NAD(P)-dependent oxidoreductase [Rhizobium leguminosarum bv. viciae]QSY84132.1 SDR family oxidoreductase [Rhizobium binae]